MSHSSIQRIAGPNQFVSDWLMSEKVLLRRQRGVIISSRKLSTFRRWSSFFIVSFYGPTRIRWLFSGSSNSWTEYPRVRVVVGVKKGATLVSLFRPETVHFWPLVVFFYCFLLRTNATSVLGVTYASGQQRDRSGQFVLNATRFTHPTQQPTNLSFL